MVWGSVCSSLKKVSLIGNTRKTQTSAIKNVAKITCCVNELRDNPIQLFFLIYVTKKFYKPALNFSLRLSNKVRFFFKKLLPSILSSGVTQINILVGTIIASFQSGAVSYLYYADRIYQINLAIAGIAIGVVVLPQLSKHIVKKDKKKI